MTRPHPVCGRTPLASEARPLVLAAGTTGCAVCGAARSSDPWPTASLCPRCYCDILAGLRRRREAALRAGPCGDGPADPMWEAA